MSETFSVQGRCGRFLDGKIWKQGCSIKCGISGSSIVSYPKPTAIQISMDVMEICEGCESTDSITKRMEAGESG